MIIENRAPLLVAVGALSLGVLSIVQSSTAYAKCDMISIDPMCPSNPYTWANQMPLWAREQAVRTQLCVLFGDFCPASAPSDAANVPYPQHRRHRYPQPAPGRLI